MRNGFWLVLAQGFAWGLVAILSVGIAAGAQPFPAEIGLSELLPEEGGDGTGGFVMNGAGFEHLAGGAVSGAGDINGDGFDDVIVGARLADVAAGTDVGAAFVVFGNADGLARIELANLYPLLGGDGSRGFVIVGILAQDEFGTSVSGAGDINGDGIADLVIGAQDAERFGNQRVGEIYVIYGRLHGFPAIFDPRRLMTVYGGDGSEGFILRGIDAGDAAGVAVSGAGDLNSDGVDDLIIGTGGADSGGLTLNGEAYLIFGRAGGLPAIFNLESLLSAAGGDGSEGVVLNGPEDSAFFGKSVGGVGDINGDGIDDVVIGASKVDPAGRDDAGATYVLFGRNTPFPAEIDTASLLLPSGEEAADGFVLNGVEPGDRSGVSVAPAGDFNGDGIADLVIGADFADPNNRDAAGACYVIFGRTDGFPASVELAGLLPLAGGDGSDGRVIKGAQATSRTCLSVNGAGDVNGDGMDDLVIGAAYANSNGRVGAGESYLLFGSKTDLPATFDLLQLRTLAGGDGTRGVVLKGIKALDKSGVSVSGAGDVNGDGLDDVIIGAEFADPNGRATAGQAYVVYGRQ